MASESLRVKYEDLLNSYWMEFNTCCRRWAAANDFVGVGGPGESFGPIWLQAVRLRSSASSYRRIGEHEPTTRSAI